MSEPEPTENVEDHGGLIYTFYSYKGGVGRSMALANVGTLLALGGRKVLLIDWDLEAPGLEAFFHKKSRVKLKNSVESTPGIVDLLEARASSKTLDWRNCILKASLDGAELDIISAGQRTGSYRSRVQAIDWGVLYDEFQIGNYLEELRDQMKAEYDLILIDSRTGITDIGDICTVLMPDHLVMLFVSNRQNIEGCIRVIDRAREARAKLPVDRAKLLVVPVACRDESGSEYEEATRWRKRFATGFKPLLSEWLPREVDAEHYFNKLYIPYIPIWSFGERLPVVESPRELRDPKTIGASYLSLSQLLAEQLDWYAVFGGESSQELKSTQIELTRTRVEYEALKSSNAALTRRSVISWTAMGVVGLGIAGGLLWSGIGVRPVADGPGELTGSIRWSKVADSPISSGRFAPDGSFIGTSSGDGTVRLWDAANGDELMAIKGKGDWATSIAFSPDGKRLATGSDADTARIWEADDGSELLRLDGHKGKVNSIAFSPNGLLLATGSDDDLARIWDASSGAELLRLEGHSGSVLSVAFSADGKRLATGSNDDTSRIWDVSSGAVLLTLTGHDDWVTSVAFTLDGSRLASGSDDRTARIWDSASGDGLLELVGHKTAVSSVAFSPDGTRLATGGADGVVLLWSPTTGNLDWSLTPEQTDIIGAISSAVFSPTGRSLLVTSTDGTVMIVDLSRAAGTA